MYKIITLILIYFYFFKNQIIFIFFKAFIFINFDKIIGYFIALFLIYSYIFLSNLIKDYLVEYIHKSEIKLYYSCNNQIIKSLLFLIAFIFYYIIYLRIFVIFSERNADLNIYFLENKYLILLKNFQIMIFFFFLLILNFLIQIMFFYAKKHYLKLHYYYFIRNFSLLKIFNKIKSFEYFIAEKNFYYFYVFIKVHLFRVILVFFFLNSIFFENGNLLKILYFLPYYSLYYFFLNIINFIIFNFQNDFDILVMESYYEEIKFVMEKSEIKKKEYVRFLLSNFSKYKFEDSIFFYFPKNLSNNSLLIQVNKFTINKEPDDFFNRIKKKKPKFIK